MTFDEFVGVYSNHVLRRVAAVVGWGVAEDVAQEVWIKVWTHFDEVTEAREPRAWLSVIAKNASIEWWRKHRRHEDFRGDIEVAEAVVADKAATPERQTISAVALERANERMNELPVKQREALSLVVNGADYAEAAFALDIPVGTFKSRLSRARRMLAGVVSVRRRARIAVPATKIIVSRQQVGGVVAEVLAGLLVAAPATVIVGRGRPSGKQFVLAKKDRRGDDATNHVLTEEQVIAMRFCYALGGTSYNKLAREYGVSNTTIMQVITGSTWRKSGGPVTMKWGTILERIDAGEFVS